MKKNLILFLFLAAIARAAFVPYHPGTRALQDDLVVPAGKSLTVSGVLNGTPASGTLNLTNVLVTLPPGTGADGRFITGSGAPSDGTGANGDAYLRTSNGAFYVKTSGTWGAPVATLAPAGSSLAAYGILDGVSTAGTYADPSWLTSLAKSKVGLGNADNTSDANKPISTATQTALDAKANANNGSHTGTTLIARADVAKINVPQIDSGTIAGAGTLTLTNSNTAYRATFSGATATIALPTPAADGVWRVDGFSTYAGGAQTITIPSLIRPEQDLDTPISSFTVPATSGGRWTAYFFAQNGTFTKVSIIGDTITQRDPAAFHVDGLNEFAALAPKVTPTTLDLLVIEDTATGAKRYIVLGSLPIASAVQSALDGKANLSGGNTWTGTQAMDRIEVPYVEMAAAAAPASPAAGLVRFYSDTSGMPNLKDSGGNVTPLGIPPHLVVAASDETSALVAGDARVTFRAPRALTLTGVRASVNTASSSGVITIRIKKNGTTIFSTNLTIDQGEKTSVTAATPFVFSATSVSDDDEMTVDIVDAGTGAKGLKIALYYR